MPEQLTELMDRCLAKSPAARLSAAEFATALREARPALAGLPALQVASPRGDGAYPTGSAAGAGTVPLVQAATDPLSDDSRSTHINQMKPIQEPLDPEEEDEPAGRRRERRRPRWIPAAIGAGLILLSALAFALSQHGSNPGQRTGSAADAATPSAAAPAGATASSTGLTALPESGGFGFAAYSSLPAPSSPVVGAVQLAYFDGFLYAAATGSDGNVRVASVPASTSTTSANWTIVPGVSSAVQPALDGASGGLELYTTATGGKVMRAVLSTPGNGWSGWTQLGTVHAVGAPAAAADGTMTVLAVATADKHLATGLVTDNGRFGSWLEVPQAGLIAPQVAVAAHGGPAAIYVVRASDNATMRVYNDGSGWQPAWPTGAVGQPATAYAADGHPDLFVLSASAGVQVFQFSGADLHGSMTWASAGVAAVNPPGVTGVPSGGVALAAVNTDGSVSVYTTTR